ncbi:SGNH/GDSL hydrolase family protein [Salinithrix halophila]|uniref:SGNH/GDSL hydrolase family protein n=1 Tax=Salinithrix halophila TaxID=1485204 RepID=A0ABV8JFB9_9BACL
MKKWKRMALLLLGAVLAGWLVNGLIPGEQVEGYEPKRESWVGAWAAAHQYPSGAAQVGVENQTVRLLLRPHLDGDKVRIRLSNAYGEKPVTFKEVTIAVAGEGASLIPGTTRKVTFSGKRSVMLPVGQEIQSDPISMKVSRDENLAVSLYVPKASGAVSWHRVAKQTSYISIPGNHSRETNATSFVTPITSWFWLSGVDVIPVDETENAVVAIGDSITDGVGSTTNTNRRYPDFLSERLRARGIPLSVLNAGISGNKVLRDDPVYGPKALDRFEQDVLNQPGVSHVILLEGINDIGHTPHNYDAQSIIRGYRQLIDMAHQNDVRIYLGTLLPYKGATYYTKEGEATRRQVNEWIRNSGAPDGVIDFERAIRDPADPNRLRPAYDSGDHLHPSDAGYRTMADVVNLNWFQ